MIKQQLVSEVMESVVTQENKHGIGPDRDQNWTRAWAFGTNFLFQFESVIRNQHDKKLKYFQLFLVRRCG